MALYLYATGAQRQTISVLSTLGLSESYTNLITKNERRECKKKTTIKTTEPTTPDPNHATPMAPPVQPVLADASFSSSQTDVMESRNTELAKKYGSRYTGTLRQLSESTRARARSIATHGLYSTVYDNINMMFRNAEQLIGRHGKVHF